VSLTDRVLDALKSAVLLEARVTSLATHTAELAREVRDIDRRLVRVETLVELASRSRSSPPPDPPAIEDRRG
jgi:hypothetical protein